MAKIDINNLTSSQKYILRALEARLKKVAKGGHASDARERDLLKLARLISAFKYRDKERDNFIRMVTNDKLVPKVSKVHDAMRKIGISIKFSNKNNQRITVISYPSNITAENIKRAAGCAANMLAIEESINGKRREKYKNRTKLEVEGKEKRNQRILKEYNKEMRKPLWDREKSSYVVATLAKKEKLKPDTVRKIIIAENKKSKGKT